MFIKRIALALKNQDWVTVTIELVLIIAGVLIALNVNNWNKNNDERVLEQQYLERLLVDLNGSIEDFNSNWKWDIARLEDQYIVLDALRTGMLAPEKEAAFMSGLAWAGMLNPQRRRWGTVDELISTGNIAIIEDLQLRRNISRLSAWYDRNNEIVQNARERAGRLRTELTRKYDIRAFNGIPPGSAFVTYDFDALTKDKRFIATFADLHLASDTIIGFSFNSIFRLARFREQLIKLLGHGSDDLPQIPEFKNYPWNVVPLVEKS